MFKRFPRFPKDRRVHLRDVLRALVEMEKRLTKEFDNLKTAVDEAVVAIDAAIAVLLNHDHPASGDDVVAIQAAADKLNAAKTALNAAVATVDGTPVDPDALAMPEDPEFPGETNAQRAERLASPTFRAADRKARGI